MTQRFTGLWRHPDFIKLWTGQTISRFGSQIGEGALRFTAILLLGATPLQISLLVAASLTPTLLLGLLAGVWVDRLRRRPILIAADVGRALLLLSIPIAFLLDALRIEQLYVVAAATGLLSIIFDVAYHSYLPVVVERDKLVEGNSKLGISDSLAEIGGPPLGGMLVQIISAPFAILIDAFSFLGSALAIARIRAPESTPERTPQRHLRREIVEGLAAIRRSPLLRALIGTGVTMSFAGGIIGSQYDLYLIRELGLSPALVGLTVGVGGVGALVGALLVEPLTRRFGLGPTMTGALAISAGTGLLLPLARGPVSVTLPLLLLMQSADVALAIYFINELSLRQAIVPQHLLGRVNASFGFVGTAARLVGVVTGGVLGQTIGLRGALAVAVVCGATARLWLSHSPIRDLQAAPEPLAPPEPLPLS